MKRKGFITLVAVLVVTIVAVGTTYVYLQNKPKPSNINYVKNDKAENNTKDEIQKISKDYDTKLYKKIIGSGRQSIGQNTVKWNIVIERLDNNDYKIDMTSNEDNFVADFKGHLVATGTASIQPYTYHQNVVSIKTPFLYVDFRKNISCESVSDDKCIILEVTALPSDGEGEIVEY